MGQPWTTPKTVFRLVGEFGKAYGFCCRTDPVVIVKLAVPVEPIVTGVAVTA